MNKKVRGVTIVGYVLALLYLSALLIYIDSMEFASFQKQGAVLTLLYVVLFFLAIFVVQLKEWARQLLVLMNTGMCVYLVVLSRQFPDFVQPSYIFMHIMAVVFFIQSSIKLYFRKDWASSRKSILIVDDDHGVLKTVQGILLANGFSVLTAMTGEKGVQIAKLQRPDLILLDVILPGIKGREVCTRLKEDASSRDIPVIFLTAKDSDDDIKAEKKVGGISHLTKPVNAKTLLAEIRKILG